jgi:hypothetical protein
MGISADPWVLAAWLFARKQAQPAITSTRQRLEELSFVTAPFDSFISLRLKRRQQRACPNSQANVGSSPEADCHGGQTFAVSAESSMLIDQVEQRKPRA